MSNEPEERQAALLKAVPEIIAYSTDWRYDSDGCFEVTLSSASVLSYCCESCREGDGVDEAEEVRRQRSELEAAGLEVVVMNDAGWSGWSCYTPDIGGYRIAQVRWPE